MSQKKCIWSLLALRAQMLMVRKVQEVAVLPVFSVLAAAGIVGNLGGETSQS